MTNAILREIIVLVTVLLSGLSFGSTFHVLEAVVLRLGAVAPITQMSYRGGFALKASGAYDAKLTTGKPYMIFCHEWCQIGALTSE